MWPNSFWPKWKPNCIYFNYFPTITEKPLGMPVHSFDLCLFRSKLNYLRPWFRLDQTISIFVVHSLRPRCSRTKWARGKSFFAAKIIVQRISCARAHLYSSHPFIRIFICRSSWTCLSGKWAFSYNHRILTNDNFLKLIPFVLTAKNYFFFVQLGRFSLCLCLSPAPLSSSTEMTVFSLIKLWSMPARRLRPMPFLHKTSNRSKQCAITLNCNIIRTQWPKIVCYGIFVPQCCETETEAAIMYWP